LVDLFGKKKLEDRIQELESGVAELVSEREELLRTLEKREDKIRKLASANQEANLALKVAEQRAAATSPASLPDLAGREEKKPMGTRMSPREMERLMKRLESCRSPEDDLLTFFLPNGAPDEAALPPDAKRALLSIRSERGWIVLIYPQLFTLLLAPPIPVREISSWEGSVFSLDALREMMETPVLVVSAHAGDTFLGVAYGQKGFEVRDFVESQVKEKHSKGGWSQKRFERLREEDIKNHVEAVLEKLSDLKGKYGSVVRFVVLGGDAALLKQIAPAVGRPVIERKLERHDERRLDRLLDEVYGFTCYRI